MLCYCGSAFLFLLISLPACSVGYPNCQHQEDGTKSQTRTRARACVRACVCVRTCACFFSRFPSSSASLAPNLWTWLACSRVAGPVCRGCGCSGKNWPGVKFHQSHLIALVARTGQRHQFVSLDWPLWFNLWRQRKGVGQQKTVVRQTMSYLYGRGKRVWSLIFFLLVRNGRGEENRKKRNQDDDEQKKKRSCDRFCDN